MYCGSHEIFVAKDRDQRVEADHLSLMMFPLNAKAADELRQSLADGGIAIRRKPSAEDLQPGGALVADREPTIAVALRGPPAVLGANAQSVRTVQ